MYYIYMYILKYGNLTMEELQFLFFLIGGFLMIFSFNSVCA